MKNKWKKIGLIAILVIIIIAIIFVVINSSSGKKEKKTSNSSINTISKTSQTNNAILQESEAENKTETSSKKVKITKLEDGTKYSLSDKEIKPDIVIGDNYYGTQLNDINLNFSQYEGKTIEIEGLYFTNMRYTYVGRYSMSVVCVDCPAGFSYFEYEWHGDEKLPVKDSESWMKIIGTLRKGNDGVDYYYIDADSIEIMNEKGLDTVNN